MDDNMDIDLELEDDDPELAQMRAQAKAIEERAQAAEAEFEAMNAIEQTEDGEVAGSDIALDKIHIRGLDNLTTANVKAFVQEHCTNDAFKRVEWIDDTSANLVFDNAEAAAQALNALSVDHTANAVHIRPAKQMSSHPTAHLEVRQAMTADVKLPGAKDRSRFYLMNPEHDPEVRAANRKRRYEDDRNGSHKRRRNDGRRTSDGGPAFNVDFYDDPPADAAEVQKKRSQIEDLFANRKPSSLVKQSSRSNDGRLRDRSASPARDGDGKYGFDDEQPYRRTARQRSVTPPHLRKVRRREYGEEDANLNKELFPDNNAAHKRTNARDLHPDHVADIFDKHSVGDTKPKGDLFDRISNGNKDRGRLSADTGLEGFSILGAAKERPENPLVKELFPLKSASQKRELFDGRIKGRATQRRRAEDLF